MAVADLLETQLSAKYDEAKCNKTYAYMLEEKEIDEYS